jgi:hypothetical protein
VSTGSNKNFDTAGQSRPNAVPGIKAPSSTHTAAVYAVSLTLAEPNSVVTQWFNGVSYIEPHHSFVHVPNGPGLPGGIGPGGADGNVGRDSLIGPGLKDMDAGLLRNINFERGVVFQFRAEVTNVMNWVSLNNPSAGNITNRQSGQHHLSRRHPARDPVGRTLDLLTKLRSERRTGVLFRP